MIAFTFVVVLALQATAAPSPASVAGTPSSPTSLAIKGHTNGDPGAVVCHSDATVGHLIHSKTCHTRAEWDRMEADGKAYLDRATRSQGGLPGR